MTFRMKQSLQDTQGIGVVEIILILVVLIGLVIIFKSQLTALVDSIFETITSESSEI
ncbi:MAG: Flp1 family type IVb pilin [Eubacteriales bacterium]